MYLEDVKSAININLWKREQGPGNGDNTSGFTALPAGQIAGDIFWGGTMEAYFWTSTQAFLNLAIRKCLEFNEDRLRTGTSPTAYNGFSLRCIKDL